jgi:hypothetical protein
MVQLTPDQLLARRESDHRRDAINASRQCYAPGCQERTIRRSHFVQRSGPLKSVAEHGHVIQFQPTKVRGQTNNRFERVGTKNAMTFRGFCQTHDNKVFALIENGAIDCTREDVALLLSYRAHLNEQRKKEINVDWYQRALADPEIASSRRREVYEQWLQFEVPNVAVCRLTQRQLESDIDVGSTSAFKFDTVELPLLPVVMSATWGSGLADYDTETGSVLITGEQDTNFVHLIPSGNRTQLLLGWSTEQTEKVDRYLSAMRATLEASFYTLTDIMFRWCESWCLRPSWYECEIRPRSAEIHDAAQHFVWKKQEPVPFSLFAPWDHERPWVWRDPAANREGNGLRTMTGIGADPNLVHRFGARGWLGTVRR